MDYREDEMKVADLIRLLQKLPQDYVVRVEGSCLSKAEDDDSIYVDDLMKTVELG